MRHYLLFVASPRQIERAKASLARIDAQALPSQSIADHFKLTHKSLGGLELRLHLLADLDAVIPHLRQNPVDLLIYDEREGGKGAVEAICSIRDDVEELAKLWGPDFHFPLSRSVAILEGGEKTAHKTFLLGREHVRDVLVAPTSLPQILLWIAHLLRADQQANEYKVGCALSGGGMEGFLYQVGCAYALEQALTGRALHDCDVFSGISSGSMVATALAAKVPLQEILHSFYGTSKILPQVKGSLLYDLAVMEIVRRFAKHTLSWRGIDPLSWSQKALRSVPTGFFKGEQLKEYIRSTLLAFGCEDQFSSLDTELYIGATNQDSFEHVVFGTQAWAHIPISEAVRASCALPPFFTPSRVQRHHFIDGMITRTCNLDLVVNRGCNLIFIIDPMKPYASWEPGSVDAQGGIYTLIQTVKTLVHTRFKAALDHATVKYRNVDFLIFQPYEECAHLMSGSPMKYRLRTNIAELAYRGTLQRLRERHSVYAVKLEKFGFKLASHKELLELERLDLKGG